MTVRKLANGKFKVQIRRNQRHGMRGVFETFDNADDANKFNNKWNHMLDQGGAPSYNKLEETTIGDVMRWYLEKVAPERKGHLWESNRLVAYLREPWARLGLNADVPLALHHWVRQRETRVTGQTVNRDMNLISGMFSQAVLLKFIPPYPNPISMVKRPKKKDQARSAKWAADDLDTWLAHLGFDPEVAPRRNKPLDYLPWFMLMLRYTGLRSGNAHGFETAEGEHDDSAEAAQHATYIPELHCIRFPAGMLKNDDPWDCPLSDDAAAIIGKLHQHNGGGRLIQANLRSLGTYYRRERNVLALEHPRLGNLRLHDLRHTFTTEVWQNLPPERRDQATLLLITGRRSMKTLLRYINPEAGELGGLIKHSGGDPLKRAAAAVAQRKRDKIKLVSNG